MEATSLFHATKQPFAGNKFCPYWSESDGKAPYLIANVLSSGSLAGRTFMVVPCPIITSCSQRGDAYVKMINRKIMNNIDI